MSSLLDISTRHAALAQSLRADLEEVWLIIERQLASDLTAVNALCKHIEQYRGKMLRPTLVLLGGTAGGGSREITERHRVLAAVVEMIHMATLVHDDVLDEAEFRRGGATVNHLRGNEAAVMLGDYLISNSFHLCSTLGDPAINLALGEVTNTVCAGELVQLHHRDNYSIDEQTYFEIVRRKTASLIGECGRLGAKLSGSSDPICNAMHGYGSALGVAFQIQDDLLDLTGDQRIVGKSLGKDLDKGKLTLPIILHLAAAEPSERSETLRLIEQGEADLLRLKLLDSGAVEHSRREATNLVDEAKAQLDALPPSPARDLMFDLADAVISRSY
jgi:octaprenyl-diphosphate synthase